MKSRVQNSQHHQIRKCKQQARGLLFGGFGCPAQKSQRVAATRKLSANPVQTNPGQ